MFLTLLFWLFIVILVIMIITVVHEFGHYSIAKYNKIRVAELSIGFGPKMFQFRRNETVYTVRWLLFGGYVSVLSDDVIKEIEKIRSNISQLSPEQLAYIERKIYPFNLQNENFENQKTLESIKPFKKSLFAAGGVLFNFLFIFSILFFSYIIIGRPTRQDDIIVSVAYETSSNNDTNLNQYIVTAFYADSSKDELLADSIEEMSKLVTEGDDYNKLTYQEIDISNLTNFSVYAPVPGVKIETGTINGNFAYLDYFWINDSGLFYPSSPGLFSYNAFWNLSVTDETSGETYDNFWINSDIFSTPKLCEFTNYYWLVNIDNNFKSAILIGNVNNIKANDLKEFTVYVPQSVANSLGFAFIDSFKYLGFSFLWLLNIISFNNLFDAMNYHPTGIVFSQGYFFLIWLFRLTVIFTLLIIIFNLLPIPPLDGWKIFEYGYEGTRKKQISKNTSKTVGWVGWSIILIYFFIFIFFI